MLRVKSFDLSIPCIILVTVAVCLIFVMTFTSRFNAHPDEHLHFKAAQYYISYWLPPAVADARSEDTYSYFGVSYLDEPDIIYLLAGKFAASLKFTGLPPFLLVRAVNFLLFGLLFLLLLKISLETGVPYYGILLLSPQIWYIFSYFNGDAFGFFVSSGLVLEFSRFLRDPEKAMPRMRIGLWLGMLLLAKRNYYVLIPVLGGIAVWYWISFSKVGKQRRALLRGWLKIVLIAAIIASPKIGYQQWVNEFKLGERRVEQMEKTAASGFKPSQVTGSFSPWHVNMYAKGRPVQELLSVHRWHFLSFESLVGVYGWMNIFSPNWYYWTILFLYLLLFGRLLWPSKPSRMSEWTLTVIAIFGMAASCIASYINSWTVAFQAQGRYLFPMFCIFLLLFAYRWEKLPRKFFYSGFLSMGVLSLWNFVFVGLSNIPR